MKPLNKMTKAELLLHVQWTESMLRHMADTYEAWAARTNQKILYEDGCALGFRTAWEFLVHGKEGVESKSKAD